MEHIFYRNVARGWSHSVFNGRLTGPRHLVDRLRKQVLRRRPEGPYSHSVEPRRRTSYTDNIIIVVRCNQKRSLAETNWWLSQKEHIIKTKSSQEVTHNTFKRWRRLKTTSDKPGRNLPRTVKAEWPYCRKYKTGVFLRTLLETVCFISLMADANNMDSGSISVLEKSEIERRQAHT